MTSPAEALVARETDDGGGHLVRVGQSEIMFSTFGDYDGDEINGVFIGTHGLPDAEAVRLARAYLAGTLEYDAGEAVWPEPGDDPAGWVTRNWGCWVERAGYDPDGPDRHWESSPAPGDPWTSPVTVVEVRYI